jgi:hypothetical protein
MDIYGSLHATLLADLEGLAVAIASASVGRHVGASSDRP